MLRAVCNKLYNQLPNGQIGNLITRKTVVPLVIPRATIVKSPKDHDESWDEYEDRMECYFNRCDIDGWELRKGLNEIAGSDFIPDPRVVMAALCACRRINDYSLTTRILEMVKHKCGDHVKTVYPWFIKELQPLFEELGIDTPENMGYGVPELALKDLHEMH